MTLQRRAFWVFVDEVAAASDGTADSMCRALRRALAACPPRVIAGHHRQFEQAVWQLYRWDVWHAAELLQRSHVTTTASAASATGW